jgi:ribosome-binding protein aMBF1 (putative translation factor)
MEEANEISDVLAEVLFSGPGTKASRIENEPSEDSGESLQQHRNYIGNKIKKYRRKLRMSQEKLAQKAGIPQSHVSRLENGQHEPTYLTIEKLSQALNVRPSDLHPGFDD